MTLPARRFALTLAGAASLALLAGGATAAAQTAPADTTITHEEIAPGVHLFRAPSALDLWTATNVVAVVDSEAVTVFDTPTRERTAQRIAAGIRAVTPKPVRTIVNSHWHMDHWSGNAVFRQAWPQARIVATTRTREYMTRMGGAFFASTLQRQVAGMRARLDTAVRAGKLDDGTPLTPAIRARREHEVDERAAFAREVAAVRRVYPDVTFADSMTIWSGGRELRLLSLTGDATGSAVLYLPGDRLLVTGDVLVTPEDGRGPPPWTTNSYAISPWLASLRALDALDARLIVPGQGPALRGERYLGLVIELYDTVLSQVHSAMRRGVTSTAEVVAAVNADAVGAKFDDFEKDREGFHAWVAVLARKAHQEALDGVVR